MIFHRIHGTGICLFTCMYHKNQPNVGTNIPYMDCIRVQRLVFSETSSKRHRTTFDFVAPGPGNYSPKKCRVSWRPTRRSRKSRKCPVRLMAYRNPPRWVGWIRKLLAPCFFSKIGTNDSLDLLDDYRYIFSKKRDQTNCKPLVYIVFFWNSAWFWDKFDTRI